MFFKFIILSILNYFIIDKNIIFNIHNESLELIKNSKRINKKI